MGKIKGWTKLQTDFYQNNNSKALLFITKSYKGLYGVRYRKCGFSDLILKSDCKNRSDALKFMMKYMRSHKNG